MSGQQGSGIAAHRRISTLLFAILAGIAALFTLGLVLVSVRLFELRSELDRLQDRSLPRLIKLSQLAQDASATSSIAPALGQAITRSEFDTLTARIRDKEASQRGLIAELEALFPDSARVETLRRSADLLIANLGQLTTAVDDRMATDRQLDDLADRFAKAALPLLATQDAQAPQEAGTVALASRAVAEFDRLRMDMTRARLARNRQAAETAFEMLARRLAETTPTDAPVSAAVAAAGAVASLWARDRTDILAAKSAQLSNAFRIRALIEENSLISNRLLSAASNEFWRAGTELETQIRLVTNTARVGLMVILGLVITLLAGAFLVLRVLNARVFRRLEQMRASLERFAEDRRHGLSDSRPDEIGEISGAMAHYMQMIEQRETELAEKTRALERLSNQLAKYLSPQVYDSIFAGRQEVKLASTRKKLTIFFSDIVDFTETADRLESEELTQLLNHYLTEMSQIAIRHGATIDKYVGDAILIFFGDPETRGVREDALACLRMAMEMRARLAQLQETWRRSGIAKPLRARMGIHSGYCTVGNFGSEDRLDYTIIGGAVNIAARLEAMAKPGEILVSYETYALVQDDVACAERGQIEVKGIAYPVATFSVTGARQAGAKGDRGLHRQTAHFRLDLDVGAMQEQDRAAARDALEEAMKRLGRDPDSPDSDRERRG